MRSLGPVCGRLLDMVLVIDSVNDVRVEDLLARPSKSGEGTARGPYITGSADNPLGSLRNGDKLHLVGPMDGDRLGGHTVTQLIDHLTALGLDRSTHLKQIHLIADNAGAGAEKSFAAELDAALQASGFHVDEIKAPIGRVRADAVGKIWVETSQGWLPSKPELNYYTGPAVQLKHR